MINFVLNSYQLSFWIVRTKKKSKILGFDNRKFK